MQEYNKYLGKMIADNLQHQKPLDSSESKITDKHLKNCRKQICDECSRLLKQ